NPAFNDAATSIALRPDGRILLGGPVDGTTGTNPGLAQLTPAGQLDPAFNGGGGKAQFDQPGNDVSLRSLVLTPNGDGYAESVYNHSGRIVTHFTASGGFDS